MTQLDSNFAKALRVVDRTGAVTPSFGDALSEHDLIYFGSPRPEINCPYNCWHLTEKGKAAL